MTKYTVFDDGDIVKYMEEDELIQEARVCSTFAEARKLAIELIELNCKEKLARLQRKRFAEFLGENHDKP